MSGANVTIITKSDTRQFHGGGSYFKRHEQFNANNYFSNQTSLARPRYRYNVWNYNIGGPVVIPGTGFNRNRDKLFFFFNQEWWPLEVPQAIMRVTVPTGLERRGDFSQTVDVNGARPTILDPVTRQPLADRIIPQNRIDPNGQALLNLFPLPNFTDIAVSGRRFLERLNLQFRAELYNAFNHAQFSAVDTAARFDNSGAQINTRLGEFTAARRARLMQFALKLNF